MLSPEAIQNLLGNAAVQELIAFMQQEYEGLNRLDDIYLTPQPPQVIAVEVRARQLALEKLGAILGPLVNPIATKQANTAGHDYGM